MGNTCSGIAADGRVTDRPMNDVRMLGAFPQNRSSLFDSSIYRKSMFHPDRRRKQSAGTGDKAEHRHQEGTVAMQGGPLALHFDFRWLPGYGATLRTYGTPEGAIVTTYPYFVPDGTSWSRAAKSDQATQKKSSPVYCSGTWLTPVRGSLPMDE